MSTVKMIQFHPEKCKGCLECEKACSKVLNKNDKGGEYSAIRIIRNEGGYEMTNCNMCGLCMDMCPVLAIARKPNGTVVVDRNRCIGCQACVAFCPDGVMRHVSGRMDPFKCIACGACVRACPENALELAEVPLEDVERTVYAYQGVCE